MEYEEDPTVRPRVYSDVLTEGGREIADGVIAINRLRFAGNTIYHTTFVMFLM